MRLALADVKKTIHRRDGTVYVSPYLLRPRERERELATLIALFEGALDRPRSVFPADLPAEIIGDYRLARCLVLCLAEWYAWQSPEWGLPPRRTRSRRWLSEASPDRRSFAWRCTTP